MWYLHVWQKLSTLNLLQSNSGLQKAATKQIYLYALRSADKGQNIIVSISFDTRAVFVPVLDFTYPWWWVPDNSNGQGVAKPTQPKWRCAESRAHPH